MNLGAEIFDKAETERLNLQQKLQVDSDELNCVLLLILAKDIGVKLPAVFDRLTTNYSIFLNPDASRDISLNRQKASIRFYCGQMGIDTITLNAIVANLIVRKRGIVGVSSLIPGDALPDLQPPKDGW